MLFNQRGSAIAGALIASAIVGIVALSAVSITEIMNKSQNFQEMRSQADNFLEEIRAHLSDTRACQITFASVNLTTGSTSPIINLYEASGAIKYKAGTKPNDGAIRLKEMNFVYNPGDLTSTGVVNGEGILFLSIEAVKGVLGPAELRPKEIHIRTSKNPATNELLECIAMAKMRKFLIAFT